MLTKLLERVETARGRTPDLPVGLREVLARELRHHWGSPVDPDHLPVWLHPGEYVVNAAQARAAGLTR